MKKILFSLVALVCSMSMNAQVMKVMKNGEEVAKYNGAEYSVVFEEAQGSTTTGTAKRTGDIEVTWVQLWENGPKFAEYNVGAANNKSEDYGGYYCWGKTIDTDLNGSYKNGFDTLTGNDDTATNLWGSNWRMPTQDEIQALIDNCDVVWTSYSGINGRLFIGKGDYANNSVFFPAAGDLYQGTVKDQGSQGYYWTSTPYVGQLDLFAYGLCFNSSSWLFVDYIGDRNMGCSVRAVLAED